MKKTIMLYWQEECSHAVLPAHKALTDFFPLTVISAGVKEPDFRSFDTARGQYDALYLLREIALADRGGKDVILVLWLIAEDISFPGYDYLHGAAKGNSAVVSTARTGFGENLRKEVCHEAGHMLGLKHCPNPCVMNTSPDQRRLDNKPMIFCGECSIQFLKTELPDDPRFENNDILDDL